MVEALNISAENGIENKIVGKKGSMSEFVQSTHNKLIDALSAQLLRLARKAGTAKVDKFLYVLERKQLHMEGICENLCSARFLSSKQERKKF